MSDGNKRTEDSYEGQTAAPLLECRSCRLADSEDCTGAAAADGDSMPVVPFMVWRYRCRHFTGQPSIRAQEIIGQGRLPRPTRGRPES